MSSALRATGIAAPGMVVQMVTVLLNIVLAPVLIAGWGTGQPLGVLGAGLASSISVAAGVLLILAYFWRLEKYVAVDRSALRPEPRVLAQMLRIGIPSGGEFVLLFVYTSLIYWIIRRFGAEAQAGFGIGMRVMQSMFMPALAISFAVPAVAGQNFGARLAPRVRETMRQAVIIEIALMLLLIVASQAAPAWMIGAFTDDPQVLAVGVGFLTIVSLNFVAVGFGMACSGMFQALGNTWPGLLSTASRLLTFVVPALLLMHRPDFAIVHVWYLSVATMVVQAVVAGLLLRWQMRTRLASLPAAQAVPA
jgi:putative MATE family efflux protein